jgi:HSP90 family molecular chaperone
VSNLLRFKTSKSKGEYKSLGEYVEGINKWQKEIYYIGGTSVKELSNSPFMDKFYEKNIEVIYFTEPADEYMMNHLRDFDGMKFRAITKENISFDDEDKDMNKRIHESYMDKFKPLIKYMQKFYGSVVMRVQISKRLNKVPAIVSSAEYGHSANMERIMRAQGFAHGQSDYMMRGTKTLEINPRHPIITKLLSEIPFDLDELPEIDQSLKDSLWNLLDAALLNGGYSITDNKAYTNRMIRTLKTQLALDSLELEPEIAPKVVEDKPEEFDLGEHDGINIDDFGKGNIEDEL